MTFTPICGAPNPELPERTSPRGDTLPAVICTASAVDKQGWPYQHKGKHRARLGRVLIRWAR